VDPSVLFSRSEPWTVDDWQELDLPDDMHWRQVEIDDGALVVSPPAAWQHDHIATQVAHLLLLADRDADLGVVGPAAAALLRTRLRVPDVVVHSRTPEALDSIRLPVGDLVLAVEVESPSSRRRDRLQKPWEYAAAGIKHYWRVEPDVPAVTAYRLVAGTYVESGRAEGAEELRLTEPFPVVVVPAGLLP